MRDLQSVCPAGLSVKYSSVCRWLAGPGAQAVPSPGSLCGSHGPSSVSAANTPLLGSVDRSFFGSFLRGVNTGVNTAEGRGTISSPALPSGRAPSMFTGVAWSPAGRVGRGSSRVSHGPDRMDSLPTGFGAGGGPFPLLPSLRARAPSTRRTSSRGGVPRGCLVARAFPLGAHRCNFGS